MQRYFVDGKNAKKNIITIIDDFHHIINVMRMNVNDEIEVVINNKVYLTKIIEIAKDYVKVEKVKIIDEYQEVYDLTIAQALIRAEKFELVIQKITEIGANALIPLEMERNVVKISQTKVQNKLNRWKKIAKEASEQAHRNTIPIINQITNVENINYEDFDIKIVAYEQEKTKKLKELLPKIKKNDKILIVIGPEGGITEQEINFFINKGFSIVSLGNNILRAETAAIYLTSVINYQLQ